jgi:hypothetical protein
MKAFAHPGAQDMSTVDLNQALESTLQLPIEGHARRAAGG